MGTVNDVPRLLRDARRPATDIGKAIARDWLWREKVEGIWLYGVTHDSIELAERTVAASAVEVLGAWFLGPMHALSGFVAKNSTAPVVSKSAVHVLLRSMLRRGALDAIAVLTRDYWPYLAAFRPGDNEEIARQVAFLECRIYEAGQLSANDLPELAVHRPAQAWRGTILRHGEYLGLGRMESGVLIAWS